MPYSLEPAGNNLYFVVTPDGRKMSKHPMPKFRAEAQQRALYSHLDQDKAMYELSKAHYEQMKALERIK